MPNLVREDIDQLNAVLTVTIPKTEYEPKFRKELNKLQEKAVIRGFRKGKTPVGFLKKMYGKGVLSDLVTKSLQEKMVEVLSDETTNFLGNPIPSEDHHPVDFSADDLKDFVFRFDIGKSPEFEVEGLNKSVEFDYYVVPVAEDMVEERFQYYRKRRGLRVETEATIEEDDMVTFEAAELDGDTLKTDGWKTTFSLLANRVADEAVKAELMTKKKGDTMRFNIYTLEAHGGREYVKKYLLNFTQADLDEGTETGEMYEAVIDKVTRLEPAEVNEEFFQQVFGEEVTTEAQAKDMIRKNLGSMDESGADALLYQEIRKHLMERNRSAMPLPDDYLKRWIEVLRKEEDSAVYDDYEKFADELRWMMIKNKVQKQFIIEVTDEEVRDLAYYRVAGYFGGYQNPELMDKMVERIMEDSRQTNSLATEVQTNKLSKEMKQAVSLREIALTSEELSEKLKALNPPEEVKELAEAAASEEE